jgi:hypothetical protein
LSIAERNPEAVPAHVPLRGIDDHGVQVAADGAHGTSPDAIALPSEEQALDKRFRSAVRAA